VIYVVTEGKIILFEAASQAKPSGNGFIVHVIDDTGAIVGNFPMRTVKFYGTSLPEVYREQYSEQVRWSKLTPEQRAIEKRMVLAKAPPPVDKPPGS
jgi:hypothetical protein